MSAGWFITLEGGDGVGKTSVIPHIEAYMQQQGYKVMITREPGGIQIAEQIRQVILDTKNTAMDGRTEALLYAAARRQHLAEKVIPALEQGITVISDRYVDSSLVYQGYTRGLGIDEVYAINQFATAGVMPDLTLWLDVEPEIGLSRIEADGAREVNRLDLEGKAFHKKVSEGYRLISERFPERIVRVDAGQDLEKVVQDSLHMLELRLQAGKASLHVK